MRVVSAIMRSQHELTSVSLTTPHTTHAQVIWQVWVDGGWLNETDFEITPCEDARDHPNHAGIPDKITLGGHSAGKAVHAKMMGACLPSCDPPSSRAMLSVSHPLSVSRHPLSLTLIVSSVRVVMLCRRLSLGA
jgi:hypothetical protein